ncbi:MAG TPA: DUF115 domain-containing protein [Spirochaetota bacterium]|nr:DUF115 domain-containing protein [Spirochaetota bacterium]
MIDYVVSETREGSKTIIGRKSGSDRDIKLHSAYNPIKEAERNVEAFNSGKCSVIIVSGIALGYHIAALKVKYPDIKIIALEKDPEVTVLCQKHNPSSLNGIPSIHSEQDLIPFFESIKLTEFKGIAHYIHRPSYQLNPQFYDNIISDMKLFISSRVSDLLTRFEFEKKWVKNIFLNMKWLGKVPGVSAFFDCFKGYPGIIVSAGPSLKKDIEYLRNLKNSAVIVCVDTAFKVLSKSGIEPHFVMTLDAQKYSFKHFTGVSFSESVLVSDIVSCPSVLNYYQGRKIISTTSKYYQDSSGKTIRETTPVMDWVENYIKSPGDIQSGGSVATSAFDLLLNMGCDRIILFGQDLAYSGREIHCSGTYHNDDWLPQINRFKNLDTINQNVIRKRKIKYVTKFDNNGKVISDFVFDLYKSWFEDSSAKIKVTVINSNSGGARIANTEERYAQDLKFPAKSVPPSSIINNIFSKFKTENINSLLQKINDVKSKLNDIITITESDSTDEEKYSGIDMILDDNDINSLLKPLMRKTDFYISRHSMDDNRIKEILYNEIKISSLKLKSFIDRLHIS